MEGEVVSKARSNRETVPASFGLEQRVGAFLQRNMIAPVLGP